MPPRRASRRPAPRSHRILVTDAETTRVYDLRDDTWNAVISNGSGGMGSVAHAEFGAGDDEVFVWSDFGAAVKVWCLRSGRAVEVRDPKFVGREGRGWGVRPGRVQGGAGAGVVALLCRSAGVDVLLLLAPRSYAVLNRVELPTTDAAGLRWSRDGRWLAVWEAASAGYQLYIYTADGHLYKTITREPADDANQWALQGLGIKSVEWVPGNALLAMGGWDGRVRILSTRTFAPVVFLDHTPIIDVPTAPVYTELVDGRGNRSYALTPQPTPPPKAPLDKHDTGLMKQGISLLAFNADASLCATRDDATPSTVWIWDLKALQPSMICIQYAPVKTLLWHPTDPSRLLIQTTHDVPIVYLYTVQKREASLCSSTSTATLTTTPLHPRHQHQHQPPPSILCLLPHLPKPNTSSSSSSSSPSHSKYQIQWLSSSSLSSSSTPPPQHTHITNPVFSLAHPHAFILVWPEGKQDAVVGVEDDSGGEEEHEEEEENEGEQSNSGDGNGSDDSLFEILTGRKSRVGDGEQDLGEDLDWSNDAAAAAATAADKAADTVLGLGKSGLDEMF